MFEWLPVEWLSILPEWLAIPTVPGLSGLIGSIVQRIFHKKQPPELFLETNLEADEYSKYAHRLYFSVYNNGESPAEDVTISFTESATENKKLGFTVNGAKFLILPSSMLMKIKEGDGPVRELDKVDWSKQNDKDYAKGRTLKKIGTIAHGERKWVGYWTIYDSSISWLPDELYIHLDCKFKKKEIAKIESFNLCQHRKDVVRTSG